ncbi:MAG TPA: DUF2480 family protein, partial [Chitinophagaceae bacterium]|nr:DUF2480 family protein [Chitinophagaceae bacterium]
YQGKKVAICCTADAVVPVWAFMLAAVYLQPIASRVAFSTPGQLSTTLLLEALDGLDPEKFRGQRVVVKGCGDQAIPTEAYVAVTSKLLPVVRSLMFGEPCSTVPLFKSP